MFFYDQLNQQVQQQVPGFPAIKRVYHLRKGLEKLFGNNQFWMEEKIDGYNVRIFKYNQSLYAATRGGFICPFTTEWARIWAQEYGLLEFFRDYPGHVLCGEVVGDNPYNCQLDSELPPGAHFRLFEINSPENFFFSPQERYQVIEKYHLPAVPVLGKYSLADISQVYSRMLELNEREREGAVFKDINGSQRLKFVTPNSDIRDLQDSLKLGFNMDSGFFFKRYLRTSLFVKEFGLPREEYARRLGEAFFAGFPDFEESFEASEVFTIYVQNFQTWETLYEMLKSQVLIRVESIQEVELQGRKMQLVRFKRRYQKSNHRYKRILNGHLHQD